MSVPMRPGFNPDRFEQALKMPRPQKPVLSAASALWRQEHGVPRGRQADPGKPKPAAQRPAGARPNPSASPDRALTH